MTVEELEKQQPIVYRFFKNVCESRRLPHALLLYGEKGAPVDQVAEFLAKSLFCEETFACGSCPECHRFDEGRVGDFYRIDGRSSAIRKEDIVELAERFELTTKEKKHQAAYLVHEISNITGEAANALLKFLEEPPLHVEAILTSTAREKILPTILSRTITLRVLPVREEFEEGEINPKIQMIVERCQFVDADGVTISADKDFDQAFQAAEDFLETLIFNYDKGLHILFTAAADQLKEPTCYNYFYNIIYQVFLKVAEQDEGCAYHDVVIGLRKHRGSIFRATLFLEKIIASQQLNFNFTLVLGKLAHILEV